VSNEEPRTLAERKADTLAKLTAPAADVWVATAGPGGAYLVPLSLAWLEERVVLVTEADSVTARNITGSGRARLGLGPTRDVVMIDTVLERVYHPGEVPDRVPAGYVAQADWDPREAGGGIRYLVLRPERIQAWRSVGELAGRTLMRDGAWL
jgi:hypothetical protein